MTSGGQPNSIHLDNLDAALMRGLRERAAQRGRSLEVEIVETLRRSLEPPPFDREAFEILSARARAMTLNRPQTPSEVLQRESRDEAR